MIYHLVSKRTKIVARAIFHIAIYATSIFMLCTARFDRINFFKIGLKLSYFCQKNTKISPDPRNDPYCKTLTMSLPVVPIFW